MDKKYQIIGWIIGPTITFAIISAVVGLTWSLALGFSIATGAKWGAIVGASIAFVVVVIGVVGGDIDMRGTKGIFLTLGYIAPVATVVGLLVWGIRTLVG